MKINTKKVGKITRFMSLVVLLASVVIASNVGWCADKPYAGKTLTILTQVGSVGEPVGILAKEWAKETGAKINWATTPQVTLFSKLMVELQSQTAPYDVIQVQPWSWGDFAPYFIDLSKYIDTNSPWYTDLLPVQNTNHMYGGQLKGIQYDGDVIALFYRKDLFEDPQERKSFKEAYGYELSSDMTLDQYLDVAEFFTRKPGEKLGGEVLAEPFYGCVDLTTTDAYVWFLQRYVAYAGPKPYLFDPNTMEPQINSPAGVEALEHFVKSLDYAPEGLLGYGFMEFANTFLNGHCALIVCWPDIGRWGSDPNMSKVIGKIGYAAAPGKKINDEMYRRAWLANGAALGIPIYSKQPEMAWDFIEYFCGPEGQLKAISMPGYGVDPVRYSAIQAPSFRARLVGGGEYLDNHMAALSMGYPDLRIPGTKEYYSVLSIYVTKALGGKVSPKECLDEAAQEWNKITDGRGLEEQRESYRRHIENLK